MTCQVAGGGVVIGLGWSGERGTRPQAGESPVALEEVDCNRVLLDAVSRQSAQRLGLVCRGGLSGPGSGADEKAFVLPGDKEERFVLPDGAADRKSIMLIASGGGADEKAFVLPGDKEERFVLPDGAADRKSIMLIASGGLRGGK